MVLSVAVLFLTVVEVVGYKHSFTIIELMVAVILIGLSFPFIISTLQQSNYNLKEFNKELSNNKSYKFFISEITKDIKSSKKITITKDGENDILRLLGVNGFSTQEVDGDVVYFLTDDKKLFKGIKVSTTERFKDVNYLHSFEDNIEMLEGVEYFNVSKSKQGQNMFFISVILKNKDKLLFTVSKG